MKTTSSGSAADKKPQTSYFGAPRAVLFDAYGTLFDVYSLGQLAEQLFPGHDATLSVLWRALPAVLGVDALGAGRADHRRASL